jgi:cytochrome b pre-mRNA-processing protein 3
MLNGFRGHGFRAIACAMSLLDRLFRRPDPHKEAVRPLYAAIIAAAREPHWYDAGEVPDTLDGRFDMVALVISLVLIRMESSAEHRRESVLLTEIFVDDMDGQMRQIGFGDMVVGKQIGRIMAALGGRLGAYRDAGDDAGRWADALERNMWRGEGAPPHGLAHVRAAALRLRGLLAAMPVDTLVTAPQLPGTDPAAQ